MTPPSAGRAATVAALRGGALVAGAGFVVGLALAVAKGGSVTGSVPLPDVAPGLAALDPAAWLTAAAIVLICTPAVALLTTAAEYLHVDRHLVGVCGLLLLIFGASIVLATRV